MTMTIDNAAARLGREVPTSERQIDTALLGLTAVLSTVLTTRLEAGISAASGQRAITRLIKAQSSLIDASSEVLRAHKELADIGVEHAVVPMHDCPPSKGEISAPLVGVAA